jgi:hypothetical protein
MKIVKFIAPFTREECLRRLRTAVEPMRAVSFVAGSPQITSKSDVVGKVGDENIRLRKVPNPGISNGFQTYLFGRLTDDGDQTRLRCRIGMHLFPVAFLVLWFGALLFMSFLLLGNMVIKVNTPSDSSTIEGWWVFIVPLLFACFGGAFFIIGRYCARDEERFLIDFLRKTINARQVE